MKIAQACQGGLLAALFLVATVHAGVNQWTATGPQGGQVSKIAWVSAPNGVALAAAGNSLYRTTDAGLTWKPVLSDLPSAPAVIAVDPSNPNRVFASVPLPFSSADIGRLYFSQDGGQTFRTQTQTNNPITVANYSADGILLYGASGSQMYVSSDQGTHWVPISGGLPGETAYEIDDIAVDPTDHSVLYVAVYRNPTTGVGGIYKSRNGGTSWNATAFAAINPIKVAIDPANTQRLLVASSTGLLLSTDAGDHLTAISAPSSSYNWVGFDLASPQRVLACGGDEFCATPSDASLTSWSPTASSFIGWAKDASLNAGLLLVGSTTGVQFSPDSAGSFETRSNGIQAASGTVCAAADGTLYAGFFEGLAGVYRADAGHWLPTNFYDQFIIQGQTPGKGLVPDIVSLSVALDNSNLVYATGFTTLMRTMDGGAHWTKPSTQLDGQIPRGVFADPKNAQVVYVTTQLSGLWKSEDGGTTMVQRSTGLPAAAGALAIDPGNTRVLYVAGLDPGTGLYKSVDSGQTWTKTGLSTSVIHNIVVDPSNSAVVYVSGVDDVYRSTDSGASWQALNTHATPWSIVVDPKEPQDLIVFGLFATDLATTMSGAVRSVDGGKSWEQVPLAPYTLPTLLYGAVLDPKSPQHIIASTGMTGLVDLRIEPDLQVVINDPPTLTRGSSASLLVYANNNGPFAASDVTLTLTLPSWMSVTSPPPGCSIAGSIMNCSLGPMAANKGLNISVPVQVAADAGTGSLAATVGGYETDSDMTNNSYSRDVASAAASSGGSGSGSGPGPAGGGGGGEFDGLSLLVLSLCLSCWAAARAAETPRRSRTGS